MNNYEIVICVLCCGIIGSFCFVAGTLFGFAVLRKAIKRIKEEIDNE